MKSLISILCILCLSAVGAAHVATASDLPKVQGEVLESKNAADYTYLRLKTQDGETWAAVSIASVTPGDQVTIEDAVVMEDFRSKPLGRTFDKIVFGVLGKK